MAKLHDPGTGRKRLYSSAAAFPQECRTVLAAVSAAAFSSAEVYTFGRMSRHHEVHYPVMMAVNGT